MDANDDVIEYRGFLLLQRRYSASATNRIKRPDGTWRSTMPTYMGMDWNAWVVGQRLPNGAIEELTIAASPEEAQRWVDARLDRQPGSC